MAVSPGLGYPVAPPSAGAPAPAPPPAPPKRPLALPLLAAAVVVLLVVGIVVSRRSDDDGGGPAVLDREAAEAATASTTATTAPPIALPPVDASLQPEIADLRQYVSDARGLPFQREVPVHLVGDARFVELLGQFSPLDPAAIAALAAYYEALGLIPEGTAASYAAELQRRFQESVLGFYDPVTEALIVRGTELDGAVRSVIVHELVHALDDQWFELDRPELDEDRASERSASLPMVVEGNAERVQLAWVDDQPPEVQAEARAVVGGDPSGQLPDNTDFIDFGILGPYQAGTPFVRHVVDRGGERLVDAVLLDPPSTTEQVLYPDVFDRREGRLPVPPPPADGPVVDQGVAGAFFWLGLLTFAESAVTPEAAAAAVQGWGGDWEVTYVVDGQTCTRTDVEGDTPADTEELLDALTQYAEERPSVTIASVDGRVRMEVCYEVPITGPDAR